MRIAMAGLLLNDMKRMLNFGIHADLQVYRLLACPSHSLSGVTCVWID